jgi:hypothetical protein
VTRPVLDYIRALRRDRPRDVVSVFVPEYVVGHWWEQLLHNQSALRLKTRLLYQPGVMVTSVPWQMDNAGSAKRGRRQDRVPVRRPEPAVPIERTVEKAKIGSG